MGDDLIRPPHDETERLLEHTHAFGGEYGRDHGDVRYRFESYRYSEDGRFMHDEVLERIHLVPGNVFLDVGCSDGSLIQNVAKANPDGVKYYGLDVDEFFISTAVLRKELNHLTDVEFMQGDAQNLADIPDDSVDVATALFMLYHVPNPSQALRELHRVMRSPESTLIATTSGPTNKIWHRQFEARIAEHFGALPPHRYNERFNPLNAVPLLEQYFDLDVEAASPPQHSRMLLKTAEQVGIYALSLASMANAFTPRLTERQILGYFDKHLYSQIMKAIEEDGHFADTIDRIMYVAHPKDLTLAV